MNPDPWARRARRWWRRGRRRGRTAPRQALGRCVWASSSRSRRRPDRFEGADARVGQSSFEGAALAFAVFNLDDALDPGLGEQVVVLDGEAVEREVAQALSPRSPVQVFCSWSLPRRSSAGGNRRRGGCSPNHLRGLGCCPRHPGRLAARHFAQRHCWSASRGGKCSRGPRHRPRHLGRRLAHHGAPRHCPNPGEVG